MKPLKNSLPESKRELFVLSIELIEIEYKIEGEVFNYNDLSNKLNKIHLILTNLIEIRKSQVSDPNYFTATDYVNERILLVRNRLLFAEVEMLNSNYNNSEKVIESVYSKMY